MKVKIEKYKEIDDIVVLRIHCEEFLFPLYYTTSRDKIKESDLLGEKDMSHEEFHLKLRELAETKIKDIKVSQKQRGSP